MTSTNPQPSYEVRVVWQHDEVEVQHHLDPRDPRFEVRLAGALIYIFVATRAWMAERRVAVEAAAELAGVEPPAPASPTAAPAGPRPEKPVPVERIRPLVFQVAELLREENHALTHANVMARAQAIVDDAVARGYRAFTELEAEAQMGVNRLHFDFEAAGREKVIIYNRF
jgi:hypothetical protein